MRDVTFWPLSLPACLVCTLGPLRVAPATSINQAHMLGQIVEPLRESTGGFEQHVSRFSTSAVTVPLSPSRYG